MFKTLLKKALLLTPPSQLNRVDSFLSGDRLRRFLSREQSNDLKVFYDIGAYKGQWSAQVSTWCPDADFFLFEANPKHTKDLTRTGFNFVITLLSSRVELKNYFAIGGTGDSYLQEMTYHYKDVKPSPITSSTLDEVAKTKGFPPPDFVKIDTQGSELDVIAGGLNCLMSAQFVVLECGLQKYNLGAPSFDDYIDTMAKLEFYPYLVLEYHFHEDVLIQMDLLFVSERYLKENLS